MFSIRIAPRLILILSFASKFETSFLINYQDTENKILKIIDF